MDFLKNEQRQYFGLSEIEHRWRAITVTPSPYDKFICTAYVDVHTVKKCILVGKDFYSEMQMNELLSDDDMLLLPKTDKGKPVLFSSSNILKRKALGMVLTYSDGLISLYNANTECDYYDCLYDDVSIDGLEEFRKWIFEWCISSTQSDLDNIQIFSKEKRRHIKYNEGDVFRFRISRNEYGYGRILLDYNLMRKNKIPFWDVFMGTPLICSVYRIITEDKNPSVAQLVDLASLPSIIMADNKLFYGEYEIIGNNPVTENEDFPIMYGSSIDIADHEKKKPFFQCGKTMKSFENMDILPGSKDFINNGVGFALNVRKKVLLDCIANNSNMPYWLQENYYPVKRDLRNPLYKDKLSAILDQISAK